MLRNLILGLLLANLLLLAWGRWIVAPDAADPRAFGDEASPRLVLLERAARTGVAGGMSTEKRARCFRLGPFSSADTAAVVGGSLSARNLPVNRYRESGQVWVGHWVQVLDLPSIAVARQTVKTLANGGIADAYISSREPTVNISLGVYRGRRGADDVIRLARDLGYTAVAMDRFRDGIQHWVEVATPADQPPDIANLHLAVQTAAGAPSINAQIVRMEELPCQSTTAIELENENENERGNGDGADDSLESQSRETGSPESSTLPE